MSDDRNGSEIAVIGMAGRFPGARSVDDLWANLCAGVDSVRFLSREEVLARGVDPALADDPSFVPAEAFPDDVEMFDAGFFDIGPREAEITDPQHRLLLECAADALADAGYSPAPSAGAVGVFAGATLNTYLLLHLMSDHRVVATVDPVQLNIANAGDFLTTRISYKLNLQGPSHTVQSACSTSLVAVGLACQKLTEEECDLALAGGVSVNLTLRGGYRHVAGGMMSPDGRCRPFDAAAQGTLFGGGVGLVVLKRLRDALTDGDTVRAVIRGVAVNNDGNRKVGYTAPSVEGQASVVAEALAHAGIGAETLGYVEAHGTATPLGDPVEVAALTRAFRGSTEKRGFCALGSLKGNVGHLDAAAGITGLIKAVLCLERERIPASLHFTAPNPEIDFAASPFYVADCLADWPRGARPRRAGVSAFGVGGTNAHVVLEEAPPAVPGSPARRCQLLVLSARSRAALDNATSALAACLESRPELDGPGLADAAFTLQLGRRAGEHRRAVLCRGREEAVAALRRETAWRDGARGKRAPAVAFLFPGQGAQTVAMTATLYAEEAVFRAEVDRASEILAPELGCDLRALLYGDGEALEQTANLQPALFTIELALARLLMSWGLQPTALLGHSLGEFVAACLAGVVSLTDGLRGAALRGRAMKALDAGLMLAVPLGEGELEEWLAAAGPGVAIAALNGPSRSVVAGARAAIEALEQQLAAAGFSTRRLATSHAFHSPMVEPAVEPFVRFLAGVPLQPPTIPFLSNLTGTWIRPEEATDPEYWGRQMRQAVRFGDDVAALLAVPGRFLVEVGPGRTLSQFVRRHPAASPEVPVVAALDAAGGLAETAALQDAVAQLWVRGVEIDWQGLHAGERRRRVPLPGYAFERSRYWIDRIDRSERINRTERIDDRIERNGQAEEASGDAGAALDSRREGHPRPPLATVYTAPGTELERRIAAVWVEMLGLDRVGVLDNFFALGGDSFIAAQTIDRLRRELACEIAVTSLYEGVTVRDLARLLADGESGASGDGAARAGEAGDGAASRDGRMSSRRLYQQALRLRRATTEKDRRVGDE